MKKVCTIINKVYGLLTMVSFFGGFLPVIPFVVALFIGGEAAENICVFLYKQYYPWIIALAAVSVMIGLVGMYLGKQKGLSVTSMSDEEKQQK